MDKQEKLAMHTANLADDNFAVLSAMFPNAVTETITGHDETGEPIIERAIDADVLAQEINTHVVSGKEERYQFTWPEKKKSILLANAPIAATLRPCREESVDFDNTENLYIKGDNLDVIKLLRETYLNKVKMIYIDPPYNTGKDFLYEDNFAEESSDFFKRDSQYDEQGNRLTSNLDSNGRFHTDWLNMMYPRLRVARDLLHDSGVVMVSIGDRELANTIKIMDEVYGANNQVCIFVWKSRAKPTNAGNAKYRPQKVSEYIVVYGKKNPDQLSHNVVSAKERAYPHEDEVGKYRLTTILTSNRGTFRRETMRFESGGYKPDEDFRWKAGKATIDKLFETNRMVLNDEGVPMGKKYSHEESDPLYPIYTYIDSDLSGTAENGKSDLSSLVGNRHGFDTVKPVQLMKYLVSTFSNENDIILDFFSGTSTSAQAVMEINGEASSTRKFIMVQVEEEIDEASEAITAGFKTVWDIALERIRQAGLKIKELGGGITQGIDVGFRVLKLDSSNMKEVYYTPEEYSQIDFNLDGFMDNIKHDRSDEDLLFQVMLDLGIPLSAKIERDGEIFNVNDNYLIACFSTVDTATITEIAQKQPYYAVFRDSSFANDSALVNVEQVFNTYSPSTIRRVL